MKYKLFLDDDCKTPGMEAFRYPPDNSYLSATSSMEAQKIVLEHGIPEFIDFDHDLSGNDTAMIFLRWLANTYPEGIKQILGYRIHSRNPDGAKNIRAFMESWKKVNE